MYQELKQQFKKVIAYSQDIRENTLNVDELFDIWLNAKRDIIEAFDGKLIYEVPTPVHFHLDQKERAKHFDDFVHRINNVYNNSDLVDFLTSNADGFYDNTVCYPYEKNDIKIPRGMKLVKAFKYFEKDQKLLEQFQNLASQVIQEDKIEGILCFSVHPLDFLSSSLNTYNWRSCHALDGDYRAGNLSYMLDKSTIICYLKGGEDTIIPMFPPSVPWNSKKWRVLLYLSERWDMITAGRQYPFSSKGGLDIVLDELLKALKEPEERYTKWHDDYVDYYINKKNERCDLNEIYIPVRRQLLKYADIVEDGPGALQFNDLLRSSTYSEPYYSIKDNVGWFYHEYGLPKFTIGREVPCLCCGKNAIRDADIMTCRHCADKYDYYSDGERLTCDCCGASIYSDDWYGVEGEVVCEECYHKECFRCEDCDELYFNENKHYDRVNNCYVCTNCFKERLEE